MNGDLKVQTNKSTISVVTITVAFLAALCVWTICWLSYKAIQIPPELNTLTGTLCGYLTGVLSKTSPTETTKNIIQTPEKSPTESNPMPVRAISSEADPVHVEGTK